MFEKREYTMKKLLWLPVSALLLAVSLVQVGCNGGDDAVEPEPQACMINVTAPVPGRQFLSGDLVDIAWQKQGGPSQVLIQLLKAGNPVATIGTVANDGYQPWTASTLGAQSGNDYSIRVTAVGETGCSDTGPEFTIFDVDGCNFVFTMPDTTSLDAGTQYEITWDSESTTDVVDLELMRMNLGDDSPVGYIASGVANTGAYTWDVDSLHEGTYGFFYLRISDPNVPGCDATSSSFEIVDEDICEIWVNAPQPGTIWHTGEQRTITFTAPNPSTTAVYLSLYQGYLLVRSIGQMNITPGVEQDYLWPVSIGTDPQGNTYRIKVTDAADQYCVGWSGNIIINGN